MGLAFPSDADVMRQADWMEVQALLAEDCNVSAEDLKSGLVAVLPDDANISNAIDIDVLEVALEEFEEIPADDNGADSEEGPGDLTNFARDEAVDKASDNVLAELERRMTDAKAAYPFELCGSLLTARTDWPQFIPYVFCLLLSHLCAVGKTIGNPPRKMFEYVCREATAAFTGGPALAIGSPRDGADMPKSFPDVINRVATEMNEGIGFRDRGLPNVNDGGVDVIAWRPFPDGASGKLVVYGNCATVANISQLKTSKSKELNPATFRETYFQDPPPSHVLRALYVPHRLATATPQWDELVRNSEIVFERCRLAHWAQGARADWGRQRTWVKRTLRALSK